MDLRWFQILILSSLLGYLQFTADFVARPTVVFSYLISGVLWQFVFSNAYRLKFNPLSVIISCLSLAILLRTNNVIIASFASFCVVAGKFWLRIDGRHIFNPSNFAIVAVLEFFPESSWLSPSQWDREVLFGFTVASAGFLLARKAGTIHSALAFLVCYLAGKGLYAAYMGDPWSIPQLTLSNGGLFIFAFYMITDPMTTPDHWQGKWIYALIIASIGNYFELFLYWPSGVFHALVIVCLAVPILNKAFVAERFLWHTKAFNKQGIKK